MRFLEILEETLKIKAKIVMKEMQPGDVVETLSDSSELESWIGFKPSTSIENGIEKFVAWFKDYSGK